MPFWSTGFVAQVDICKKILKIYLELVSMNSCGSKVGRLEPSVCMPLLKRIEEHPFVRGRLDHGGALMAYFTASKLDLPSDLKSSVSALVQAALAFTGGLSDLKYAYYHCEQFPLGDQIEDPTTDWHVDLSSPPIRRTFCVFAGGIPFEWVNGDFPLGQYGELKDKRAISQGIESGALKVNVLSDGEVANVNNTCVHRRRPFEPGRPPVLRHWVEASYNLPDERASFSPPELWLVGRFSR